MIPIPIDDQNGSGIDSSNRFIDVTSPTGVTSLPLDTLPTIIPIPNPVTVNSDGNTFVNTSTLPTNSNDGNTFINITNGTITGVVRNGVPLLPTATLVTPYVDPAFTRRATSVDNMFSFVMSHPSVDFSYDIGRAPVSTPVSCSFRNNTLNTDLQLEINVPSYVTPSINGPILVGKNRTIRFYFSINEAGCVAEIPTGNVTFSDLIKLTVTPENVIEPVFVRTDLPQLVLI